MELYYPAGGFKPISRILNRLYIGCLASARDLIADNPNNIRFVLNCTPNKIVLPAPFRVMTMHFEDGSELGAEAVLFCTRWIYDLIELGNVMVCCHAGISRSPAITAAYLVRCGFNWDDAVEFITKRRPQVQIHPLISLSIRKALGVAPIKESLIGGDKKDETKTN